MNAVNMWRFLLCGGRRCAMCSPLAMCVLVLAGAAFAEETPATKSRPNFILCMTDDQGWGDTGYNGHPHLQTPALDEMAAAGLRFDRFYSASSVCSPTRGSVLTGRNPNRFGCFSWGHTLRPQEVTVAEALRAAGYTTGHFGKWHVGPVRAGWENSPGESGFDRWISSPNFYQNDPLMSDQGRVVQLSGESSQVTVEAALKFIAEAQRGEKPFLAVIWFGNPHNPHEGWPELVKLYEQHTLAEQNYYAEVTGVDRAMGHLRRELRRLNLADNTLVWFNSDNGAQGPAGPKEPGSTGGLRGRKGSLYEGGIRVPCIIEWPARIPQSRITNMPASTVDIYPTLLELAGATVAHQPQLDGESLVALIDGKQTERKRPLAFWDYPIRGISTPSRKLLEAQAAEERDPTVSSAAAVPNFTPLRDDVRPGDAVWMDGDWKLQQFVDAAGEARYELYNLANDRGEAHDLAEREPARREQMKEALAAWQKSVVASHNGADYVVQKDAPPQENDGAANKPKARLLFDGKTLAGWEGNEKMFRVEDGAIVAGTLNEKIPHNEFLCTMREFEDFELRLKVKLVPNNGNAGIQFRSRRVPDHFEVSGYQADMGEKWWGKLYDESRRSKVLAEQGAEKLKDVLKVEDWNEYVIRCEGRRVQLFVNGVQTVDYTEEDESIPTRGVIGLQIHGGPPAEASYKDIVIEELGR